jgi:fatty acid amide hydrolase
MELDADTKKKLLYGLPVAAGALLLYKLLKSKPQDKSYEQIITRKRSLRDAAVQSFNVAPPAPEIQGRILYKTVTELKQGLASGSFTSEDIVLTFIHQTIDVGLRLEAVTDVNFEEALHTARECDRQRREGHAAGLLHGIPISIKDNFHMKGFDSTCGLTANCFKPSEEDGIPVLAVRLQGGIPFVKSNLPFAVVAYDSSNQIWGNVKNPWKLERTPGGSSGGEAALVATACSPLGLANDLAGSIRFPSSVTGLYGFVCSPERGNTTGEHNITQPHGGRYTPYEWGRAGPIGRCVDDLVLMMKTLWSDEVFERDRLIPRLPFNDSLYQEKGPIVVALVENSLWELPAVVKRALNETAAALQSLGHRVVKVDINMVEIAQNFYDIMSGGDFWNKVDEMRGSQPLSPAAQGAVDMSKLSNITKRLVFAKMRLSGNRKLADLVSSFGVKSAYDLMGLLGKRTELIRKVIGQLQAVGAQVVLMPATITPAPVIGKGSLCELANTHIIAATHLTFPTGVVPVTTVREDEQTYDAPKGDSVAQSIAEAVAGSAGLPLGVQISALPYKDELCLRIMRELQEVIAFQCRPVG